MEVKEKVLSEKRGYHVQTCKVGSVEVARVWINGQMALSHRAQHTCYRRKDRTTLTKKPGEYDIEKLKLSILFFFPPVSESHLFLSGH